MTTPSLQAASEYNLDGMSIPELLLFVEQTQDITAAKVVLFPDIAASPETAMAAFQLHNYAKIKALAMENRIAGYIQDALHYEAECDKIYTNLNDWAKGW